MFHKAFSKVNLVLKIFKKDIDHKKHKVDAVTMIYKKIYDKKYSSYYIYTNNLDKALKLFVKSKSSKKLTDLQLENIAIELRKNLKFNKVPDKFFLDK